MLYPPVALAVATRARELPVAAGWAYEPKLDGYRCCALGGRGLLQSRQGSTAMTSRFPEVLADLAALGDVVLDGELVALRAGRLVFSALQAGPRRRGRGGITAVLVAFDCLSLGERDLRGQSYSARRTVLERVLARSRPHVQLIEQTTDPRAAREWMSPAWGAAGVEGVVAKPVTSRYLPGQRSGWLKIRQTHTREVVVLGVTEENSLVLGGPGRTGWRVVGLSLPLSRELRTELAERLSLDPDQPEPVRLPGVATGLPGGPEVTYQPVRPDTVVEIEADTATEHGRQRHRSRVRRVRPDRAPAELR
ncbi:ATP-dependent DNA ligase [Saccharopolyspora rhizosphaerae]|uniref:ATP-dependent DNA ligase n=1 Tax=Saccharopolyspora rhizosphaerae TaxID=2492662 RepID=A0A426JMV4_9PSEU|nr:RNA ligase family protein [Saccharopolyspora rhizosphaerae]RRO14549.1 ATP-dependent DNA ligase [Saccharopolyspora rhizosphaerae]